MYDIQFIIPVSSEKKYKKRLKDFLDTFGLYNIQNRKVKIYFLIGTDDIDSKEFQTSLAHIELIKCKSNHLVVKIYDFLSHMTLEQASQAKWTAKIDDDCFNDIEAMMKVLEEYDCEEKHYLVPDPLIREDFDDIEIECLEKINALKKVMPNIYHEVEASWTSRKTMMLINQNKDCKKLFDERKKHEDGVSDQCMALAAKLTKSPLQKEKRFFADDTVRIPLADCTLFGGNVSHVHPLAHDKNPVIYEIFEAKIKNKKNENTLFFENKQYVIRHEEYLIEIKLEEFGQVNSDFYQTWSIIDDQLVLMGQEDDETKEKFSISDLKERKFSKNKHVSIYEV